MPDMPLTEPMERTVPSTARFLTIALFAASGFFFLWLLVPVLLGQTFVAGDLLSQSLPFRKFYADALQHHQSFLWSPDLYGGFYLHGEGQAGMMHPFHLLLYSLLPLVPAFGVEIMSSYIFLFAGSFLLFRFAWKLNAQAALFGSFLFTFGGTNLTLLEHLNAVAVVAHLPWILLAIHGAFEPGNPRRQALWVSAIALLTGSQILLGHPQSVWFCAIIEVGYAVCLMSMEIRWRALMQVFAALAVGVLIGAVQILPTLTAVRDSVRADPPLAFLSTMSLQPSELLQWINPLVWKGARYDQQRGFYNYLIYFGGPVTLLLFAWILSRKDEDRSRLKLCRFLGILAFAGMFLALGKYNLVFPWYAKLPVIGLFRAPARYTILTDFAVAAGAALAVDRLLTKNGDPASSRLMQLTAGFFAVGSIATVLLVFVSPRGNMAQHLASPPLIVAGALWVAAGAGLFLASGRRPRIASAVLILFVLVDVAGFQGMGLLLHDKIGDAYPDNSVPVDPPGPVQTHFGDQLMLLNYRLVDGYSGLEPVAPIPIESTIYARIMGARAVLRDKWLLIPDPLPLLRLRNRAVVMENRDALLNDSSLLAQSSLMEQPFTPPGLEHDLNQALHFDFSAGALVETPVILDPRASGALTLVAEEPGRVSLTAHATGAMLATIGERFHPGWKVLMDGRPRDALRVDGSLLGFIVPAGNHTIQCRFDPGDFRYGAWASAIGILATMLYVGLHLVL